MGDTISDPGPKLRRMGRIVNAAEIHDLLSASFYPLTENFRDSEKVYAQAKVFLSAFSEGQATWDVDVSNLPVRIGQAIYGLSTFSRHPAVLARFTRFRFPFIRLEHYADALQRHSTSP